MKNLIMLLNRVLDGLQSSQQGRRSPSPCSPRCIATAPGGSRGGAGLGWERWGAGTRWEANERLTAWPRVAPRRVSGAGRRRLISARCEALFACCVVCPPRKLMSAAVCARAGVRADVRACVARIRLLGFFLFALAVLYWLTRRSSRSGRRPTPGRIGSDVVSAQTPTVALKPGFHRMPVQHRVSIISNDSLFDSTELSSIDGEANSAAAVSSVPRALRILPSGLASVLELARTCDLYVITQCSSDATQDAVHRALCDNGVVDAGLNPHKILFCETATGRGAMARQLEPALHIDSCGTTLHALAPFVPAMAAVRTPHNVEALDRLAVASHVTAIDDLSQYFMLPSHAFAAHSA